MKSSDDLLAALFAHLGGTTTGTRHLPVRTPVPGVEGLAEHSEGASEAALLTQLARLRATRPGTKLRKSSAAAHEARRAYEAALERVPGDPVVRREFETLLRCIDDRQTLPSIYLPAGPMLRGWYAGQTLEQLSGHSLEQLEARWLSHLDSIEVPPEAMGVAKARFDRPAVFGRHCPHAVDRLRQLVAHTLFGGIFIEARFRFDPGRGSLDHRAEPGARVDGQVAHEPEHGQWVQADHVG